MGLLCLDSKLAVKSGRGEMKLKWLARCGVSISLGGGPDKSIFNKRKITTSLSGEMVHILKLLSDAVSVESATQVCRNQ